jgi:hypothetical protein
MLDTVKENCIISPILRVSAPNEKPVHLDGLFLCPAWH